MQASATYTYDGDDNLVMSVVNGITTYYAASSYVVEVDGETTTVKKAYMAGSTSIAVRTIVGEENTLNWVLGDHLGSASVTTTADGTWFSELRYSAFGETRYSSGITPTDYRYTSQLQQADVNLYYYNARWYDPELGRFIQADTIIPGAGNSKSYDRFTYVNYNPIKYIDPSGHCISNSGVRMGEYPYGTSGLCSDYIIKKPSTSNTTDNKKSTNITLDSPNDECSKNPFCVAAYDTYSQLTKEKGSKVTVPEILKMTATAEYYSYIYYQNAGNLRSLAQEALARQFYFYCGPEDNACTDNQIYMFLAGFEPWWSTANTPVERTSNLKKLYTDNTYKDELEIDIVEQIYNYGYASEKGWVTGYKWNRPWQWRNYPEPPQELGYSNRFGAIMYLTLPESTYGGGYFAIVTGWQNTCNKYPNSETCVD